MSNAYVSPGMPFSGAAEAENATFSWSDSFQKYSYFAVLGLVALLTYSFWNMLQETAPFWEDDQYSHGYLVPFIAVYIAWSMRPNPAAQQPPEGQEAETFMGIVPAGVIAKVGSGVAIATIVGARFLKRGGQDQALDFLGSTSGIAIASLVILLFGYVLIGQPFNRVSQAERWIGLAILLAAYALRIVVGGQLYVEPADRIAYVIALVGGFLMIGGWSFLRWAGPGTGFLLFMFPIPSVFEKPLLLFLQKLAAIFSEVVLTILGQPVHRDGWRIVMAGVTDPLEVAEACSGLRMLTIFGGFAVACALLIKRPWWDKLIVLLSAIPIALIVNITRIVVTALLYKIFPESEAVKQLVHDYAGLAMMPLAMGLLLLLLKILETLSSKEEEIGDYGGGSLGHAGPAPVS